VASRFPFEPFDPEKLPDPVEEDGVHRLALRGAMAGADAYRLTRSAVRREGGTLRVGNRFVPIDRYREVGFVALGRAAISQALAAFHALGDRLTQGYVVAPDPLPIEIPFRFETVPASGPGRADAERFGAAVVELARGLAPTDLFLLLLSPGALGYLATAPSGRSPEAWQSELQELLAAGATPQELESFVRLTARGPIAGRFGADVRADIATFVVDRGDGASLLGGGPTVPVEGEERTRARAMLERIGAWSRLPADEQAGFSPDISGIARLPETVHRPVIVAEPADALREASGAVADKKWLPRLADLTNDLPPAAAVARFLERSEQILRETAQEPMRHEGKGVVVFGPLSLGLPEGADETVAIGEFLSGVAVQLRRREMTVAIVRTAGGRPGDSAPPGGVVGSSTAGTALRARALRMRSGITDVGLIATAVVPNEPRR
jgi:glycerate-2-kinase